MKQSTTNAIKTKCTSAVVKLTAIAYSGCSMLATVNAETDVGKNVTLGGRKLLNEITAVYCNSLGWLLAAINVAILMFSKNDKAVAFAKKALFGVVAVYIVLKILNTANGGIIGSTTDTMTQWISG